MRLLNFNLLFSNFDPTGGSGAGGISLRAGRAFSHWIFDDIVRLYGILALLVDFRCKNTVIISVSF